MRITMNTSGTLTIAVLGAVAVMGCTSLEPLVSSASQIQPFQSVRHGGNAEALYRTGRYFQGQSRYDQAIAAYTQALAADPRHFDAHNALGVIHALIGQPERAEREFRAALAIAPDAAHIHNNFGYHLMLRSDDTLALAMLERAHALDADNPMVSANLATVRARLGQNVLVQPIVFGDVGPMTPIPATEAKLQTTPNVRLEKLAEGVWELRGGQVMEPARALPIDPAALSSTLRVPATIVPLMPNPAMLAPATFESIGQRIEVYPRSARAPSGSSLPTIAAGMHMSAAATSVPISKERQVEIANGNGQTGLARHVSLWLAPRGVEQARLTNHKPYDVAASRIQYVAGADAIARSIKTELNIELPLVQVASLSGNVRVRVLLGKDFPHVPMGNALHGETIPSLASAVLSTPK